MSPQSLRQELVISDLLNKSMQLYVDNAKIFLPLAFLAVAGTVLRTLLGFSNALWADTLNLVLAPFCFVSGLFFLQAVNVVVHRRYLGEDVSIGEAMRAVLKKFFVLLFGTLLFLLIIVVGIILIVIPGVYWMLNFFFFAFAILFENKGIRQSLITSDELMRGHFLKVIRGHGAVVLVCFAFILPISIGLFLVGTPLIVIGLLIQVMIALLLPLIAGFYYQIYLWLNDQRSQVGRISLHKVV